MKNPKNSKDEELELPEEEEIEEEEKGEDTEEESGEGLGELGEEWGEEEEEELGEKEEERPDALGFLSFLIFICIVFFLAISIWQGTYPFSTIPAYSFTGAVVGREVIIYDRFVFNMLYWIGFGFLLIGMWRYKYEYWLIILVAILGTMIFFMFLV